MVVEPQSGPDGERAPHERTRLPRKHQQKFKLTHQMRGLLEEALTLMQRFPNHSQLTVLQITQPAVDNACGAAGGAAGEVVLLHQQGTPPVAGALPGDGYPVDAAADHQNLKSLVLNCKRATHSLY